MTTTAAQIEYEYEQGDRVIHPQQGAGMVVGIIQMDLTGEPVAYYRIELLNDAGVLMIPVMQAEELGLREARFSSEDIREILEHEPQELNDHYRARQARAEKLLTTGTLRQVVQVLRDFVYRERVNKLTTYDYKLKDRARKKVISEIAADAEVTLETAGRRLNKLIDQAMAKHIPELEAAS